MRFEGEKIPRSEDSDKTGCSNKVVEGVRLSFTIKKERVRKEQKQD